MKSDSRSLKAASTSHIKVLAHCVVKLPPRDRVAFVGSRLPNSLGEYEIDFRDESTGAVDFITVPKEMVYAAVASGGVADLMAYMSTKYLLLFRKGPADPSTDPPIGFVADS